ncbi:acyltransferase family protein [Pedobacter sp. AW31-3R]|uniref:acyltransferase family protein n=1 Tax=Pedobacter sp. AW31-3R TaxID=3445781 RepID=UPI003F9F2981
MKGKLQKLEAIRGFAALYIVLCHLGIHKWKIAGHDLSFLLKSGQEAVMLFFILSGFVIHYSFQRSADKSFIGFFKKRFYRIYIPLGIVFLTSYVLYAAYSKPLETDILQQLFGNLFMLQDLEEVRPRVLCAPFLNNNPLWSLSFEWWFYMIYFVVQKYYKEKAFFVVSVLSIAATASYLIYPFFVNRIFMYLILWWAGVEMADLYGNGKQINFRNLRNLYLVLGSCSLLLLINCRGYFGDIEIGKYPFLEVRHFIFTLLAITIALLWKKAHWLLFDYTLGLFAFLAPVSFVLYISHWFLVIRPDYLDFMGDLKLQVMAGIPICLLYSFLVEMKIYPFLRKWLN